MSPARSPRIPLWVDLRHVPVNKRLPFLKAVRACGCEHVLLGTDDPHLDRSDVDALRIDGNNHLKRGTTRLGRLLAMRSAKDQEKAAEAQEIIIIDSGDWTIIPLENLIAARRDRPGTLFARASSAEDVRVFRDTLDVGVHGIVLAPESPAVIEESDAWLRSRGARRDDATTPAGAADADGSGPSDPQTRPGSGDFLVPATITRIEDAGAGDRVCIDSTSLFRDGEGLLIGSTARGFALVHAETLESEYVNARPFRVNAGAVHSYLYAPGGKTRYLSEVRAGDHILAVHPDGVHRVLTVGRAKIERRPHNLIAWATEDGREGNAVLQTAETIRLVRPDGGVVAVTELAVGDEIMVHTETSARHFGMAVEEFLEEV